jgi:hypothetical protein
MNAISGDSHLEECLEKIQAMVTRAQVNDFMALGAARRSFVTLPRLPVGLPGPLCIIDGAVPRTLRVSTGAPTSAVRWHRRASSPGPPP